MASRPGTSFPQDMKRANLHQFGCAAYLLFFVQQIVFKSHVFGHTSRALAVLFSIRVEKVSEGEQLFEHHNSCRAKKGSE